MRSDDPGPQGEPAVRYRLRMQPLPLSSFYDITDGRPNLRTVYTRCPSCSVVEVASAALYSLTGDGRFEPGRPIVFKCATDGGTFETTPSGFIERDTSRMCQMPGCRGIFRCPSSADRAMCPSCCGIDEGPFTSND